MKTTPKIIYLGRDMVYHSTKACDTKADAIAYINTQSGKGYVEIFELNGDYYHFKSAEWTGATDKNTFRGSFFGSEMPEGVHIKYVAVTLGYLS